MKRRVAEFLVLLLVAIGAGPATSAVYQWSLTSGSNANADPSINWAEGMSPSSVNDSARAMMSAIAGWRDDMSGQEVSTGSGTAYAVTTNQGYPATTPDGTKISFVAHAANGASATLAADGGTAYPIWISQSVPAPAGTLVAGTPYNMTLRGGSWFMQDMVGNPYNVALGAFMLSTAPTAPNSNFVEPAGQCISTTTYAAYWVQQGSPASGACAGGQFAIIDVRGSAVVALDTLNGSAANRLTTNGNGCGTAMTTVGARCANGTESRTLTYFQIPANIPYNDPGHSHTIGEVQATSTIAGSFLYRGSVNGGTFPIGPTSTVTTGITLNPSGGGAHSVVMPAIGVKYYLRVL